MAPHGAKNSKPGCLFRPNFLKQVVIEMQKNGTPLSKIFKVPPGTLSSICIANAKRKHIFYIGIIGIILLFSTKEHPLFDISCIASFCSISPRKHEYFCNLSESPIPWKEFLIHDKPSVSW